MAFFGAVLRSRGSRSRRKSRVCGGGFLGWLLENSVCAGFQRGVKNIQKLVLVKV
jgi:hypothetical protein